MFDPVGLTPANTDGQTPTDHVFWRGQWHRFAGGDETPPGEITPPVVPPVTPPVTPPAADPPAKPFDDAYVRDLRKENATYRKAAEEAQARLAAIDDANKTELEKAQAKLAATEAQLASATAAHRDALIRAAIEREATKANVAIAPERVYLLIDRSGLELADDGSVSGVEKAVKALLAAEPHLVKGAVTAAIPGTPRPNGSSSAVDDEQARQTQGAWLRGRI